jgi:hypothetical protein
MRPPAAPNGKMHVVHPTPQRESVNGLHLLYALTQPDEGAVADLLARFGSSAAIARPALERSL